MAIRTPLQTFSTERIAEIPPAFKICKRTVDGKNYMLVIHPDGRTIVYGQNRSTGMYSSAYRTAAEAAQVVEAVGPVGSHLAAGE
jgi:hypothetical protein